MIDSTVPPSVSFDTGEITALLSRWNEGDSDALHGVIAALYPQLRAMAAGQLGGNGPKTLQPTAVINEAYLRLVSDQKMPFENRNHFFWFAGVLMRRVIVQYARKAGAAKRGGPGDDLSLEENLAPSEEARFDPVTLIALDEAITRLAEIDARMARIVTLRFFAGLEVKEIAEVLEISPATVKRDWATARFWLARALDASEEEETP